MTTTFVLNLILALAIVGALAVVCRTAYRAAGGFLDRCRDEVELPVEDQRLAA
jgi:hypothetical protein